MTIIFTVVGFFLNNRLGQYALGALGIVALVVGFASHERSVGAEKAVAKIEAKGKKINVQATNARRAAERDADRVLERYFRD